MKRALIIGAALLVQVAAAQETNQIDEPNEAASKFFERGYAYKGNLRDPVRRGDLNTNELRTNFISDLYVADPGENAMKRDIGDLTNGVFYEVKLRPAEDEHATNGVYWHTTPDPKEIEKRIARAYADGAKMFGLIGAFIGALAFALMGKKKEKNEDLPLGKWNQQHATGYIVTLETNRKLDELETLRARVAELEGLEVGGVYRWGNQVSAVVRLPIGSMPEIQKTLGQAIPTKGTR